MWTTDTFLQNLARFSALKGQGGEGPMAVGTDPRPSGRTPRVGTDPSRRDGPLASGRTHGGRDGPTVVRKFNGSF